MKRSLCTLIAIGMFLGCSAPLAENGIYASQLPAEFRSTPREQAKPNFGPPPPGYIRIRGEAVPNWQPEDLVPGPREIDQWHSLGPKPITFEYWAGNDDASGRVVSIAIDPTDPQTVFIASASGGIWKTIDGGNLWLPLTDELSNLNHGAVAIDPSDPDVIYAGTGEYTMQTEGDGLFRSTDGGIMWERIATTGQVGTTCSGAAVDPGDPDIIHLTGDLGYCRSTDGGETWSVPLSGAASSLALKPANPAIVYVGRHSNGVWRSTDSGASWTRLTGGLPGSGMSRILVAVTAANPDVVYTAILDYSSHLQGLYRSDDGGDSWTWKPNTPDFPYPQGWYDMFLGVDPADEDTVYCGGVFPTYAVAGVIKSTDGGDSWTDITIASDGSQLHPDQHVVAFGSDGVVWIGNDGGVWKSLDGGDTWINTNHTLQITQNYNIGLHPTDPAQLMGGTQDNGTVGREQDVDEWPQVIGGDGGFLAYDHAEPQRKYTTYVYLTIFRFDENGVENITGPWDGDSRNFIAPLVMDPSDSNTLLGGTNRVWRTTNAAATDPNEIIWTPISGTNVSSGGRLNAIAVSHQNSNKIYVGNTQGNVYLTEDGSNWVERSAELPNGQISDICVDPENDAALYVAFHRVLGRRVLRSDDSGLTWVNVSGDLPSGVSARALAVDWRFDPPDLYAGSGVGVYCSIDGGPHWQKDGNDLPNVNIGDLQIDPANNTITAGTYGRGAWRAALRGEGIPGDLDSDGDVDLADLAQLLGSYGGCTGDPGFDPNADLDNDGCVTLADLAILLGNYGLP